MADVLVSTTCTLFSNVFDQVSCLQGQVQFLFWSEEVPLCFLKHTKAEESASASHVKWGKTNTDTGCKVQVLGATEDVKKQAVVL